MSRNFDDWLKTYMEFFGLFRGSDSLSLLDWSIYNLRCVASPSPGSIWGISNGCQNFYIVLVAPPGIVQKSSTADIGMRLLRQIKEIKFGPQSTTWQSLVSKLAESTVPMGGLEQKKVIPMSALTIVASEFGTFMNMNDNEMIDVLVDLWDGKDGPWEKATKTAGADIIQNPCINIIGCTTPSWIAGHFPEYMIHGGFASRTIFIYADRKAKRVPYPFDEIPKEIMELHDPLVEDLTKISKLLGPMDMTPEAIEFGTQWYHNHMDFIETNHPEDRLGGFYARKQTHIHKLAMILSAARRDTRVIEARDLSDSVTLINSIEAAIPQVFSKITASEARAASTLIGLVDHYGQISYQEAFQKLLQSMSYREFQEATKALVAAGRLVLEQRK